MRTNIRQWLRAALVGLGAIAASGAWADTVSGTVTRVRDGDSVVLTTERGQQIEVRLHGIDAPERGGSKPGGTKRGAGQPYAEKAQDMLNRLAFRKRATLETLDTDSYGRRVGLLRIASERGPVDAGLMQVQMGMAWAFPRALERLPYDLRESYLYAQKIAKLKRRGLWADEKPQAPWDWRPAAAKKAVRR
jgi:endonuclease YncB( thermonuclease family)